MDEELVVRRSHAPLRSIHHLLTHTYERHCIMEKAHPLMKETVLWRRLLFAQCSSIALHTNIHSW